MLSAELGAWVERTVGRDARIVASRRLTGGLTSLVLELTIAMNGRREQVVLRSYQPDGKHDDSIVRSLESEAVVLSRLERTDIPAPRVIGWTTNPLHGGPALLMTRLPGEVYLMPRDRDDWLRQMAATLARIHALPAEGPVFESWNDPNQMTPPANATRPDLWRAAVDFASGARPATARTFIHRDYQHFNLLWSSERLTGVVDWAGACVGPPDVDVGHCRLNLTLLCSAEIADRFRDLYEAESGRSVNACWDIHSLLSSGPDWGHFLPIQIDGRAQFDANGMTTRMEEVLDRALRRGER